MTSDDSDHIPTDPTTQKASKKDPPRPGPLPYYKPLTINDFTNGTSNLSNGACSQQLYVCLACKYAGRKSSPGMTRQRPRKPLGELLVNTIRGQKRRDRISRTRHGCRLHDNYLY